MKKHVTIFSGVIGVIFIIVGIIGLLIPIFPDILFIIIGLGFLGYPVSKWFKKFYFWKSKKSKKKR
jgi:uncharacterized membrane protein YbaN (DUF454 family)